MGLVGRCTHTGLELKEKIKTMVYMQIVYKSEQIKNVTEEKNDYLGGIFIIFRNLREIQKHQAMKFIISCYVEISSAHLANGLFIYYSLNHFITRLISFNT